MSRKRNESAIALGLISSREENISKRKAIRERMTEGYGDSISGEVVGEFELPLNEDGTFNFDSHISNDINIPFKEDGTLNFKEATGSSTGAYGNAFDDCTVLIDVVKTLKYNALSYQHANLVKKILGSFTEYITNDTPMEAEQYLMNVHKFYQNKFEIGFSVDEADSVNIVTAGLNYGSHSHADIDMYVELLPQYFNTPTDDIFTQLHDVMGKLLGHTILDINAADDLYKGLYKTLPDEPRNAGKAVMLESPIETFKSKLQEKILHKKRLTPHYVYDIDTGKVLDIADNYDSAIALDKGDVICVSDYDKLFPNGEIIPEVDVIIEETETETE